MGWATEIGCHDESFDFNDLAENLIQLQFYEVLHWVLFRGVADAASAH